MKVVPISLDCTVFHFRYLFLAYPVEKYTKFLNILFTTYNYYEFIVLIFDVHSFCNDLKDL